MSPVKLKIRTPCLNEGRDLEVDRDWTVGQLKDLIAREWPNHPKPSDQRLIYAGKLLDKECCVLSTILRMEMNDEHTIHLVVKSAAAAAITAASKAAASSGSSGLRHRAAAAAQRQTDTVASAAVTPPTESNANSNATPAVNAAATPTSPEWEVYQQQMQQYYARYLQYMQYYQQQNNQWNTAAAPVVHQQQLNQGVAAAPLAAAALAAQLQQQQQLAVVPAAADAPVQAAIPGVAEVADMAGADGNLGNNDNVMMNAGAAVGAVQEGDEDEVPGQRDIFDWFYVLSRVLIVFSVFYSYSSLSRFALIAMIAIIVYLYKSVVNGNQRPDLNQPRAANPPPAAPNQQQAAVDQQQAAVEQQPRVATGNQEEAANQQQAAADGEPELQPQPAAVTARAEAPAGGAWYDMAITFVTTFFTSIVPDNNDPQVF